MARKRRTIRFSDEEWERARRDAEKYNMGRAPYIRAVATGALDPNKRRGRDETVRKLFQVGTEIRQLKERYDEAEARKALGSDFEHDSVALGRILDTLKGTLDDLDAYRGAEPEEASETGVEGASAAPQRCEESARGRQPGSDGEASA